MIWRKILVACTIAFVIFLALGCWLTNSLRAQPHKAGGGPPGIALQSTTPGVMQSGHANISGTFCIGCDAPTTGARLSMGSGPTLVIRNVMTQPSSPVLSLQQSGTSNTISLSKYQDDAVSLAAAADGLATTIGTGTATTSLHLHGQPGTTGTVPSVRIESSFGTTMTAGNIVSFDNPPGTSKGSIAFNGAPTFAAPVPITSGGTGQATALNCPYVGSNGTAFSCTAAPATLIGSGRISSTGTITSQSGLAITVTKGATGNYTVNATGMTANGVVMITPIIGGAGAGRMSAATPAAGSFAVYIKTGADGAIDDAFQYAIISL